MSTLSIHQTPPNVNHAFLVKLSVQSNDGQTMDVHSQIPLMTPRLYRRVLQEAKDVSVDIPVPSPSSQSNSEDITLLEYPLTTLASLFVIEPLDVEYSTLPPPVLKALRVDSYHEAPIFDLINRAYQDKVGHAPHDHPYFEKLKEMKYRISSTKTLCQAKHNSFDEEAMKQLTDNHMFDVFDNLYRHLAEMETEDPEHVGLAIQNQIDKVNAFYKKVYDEQRERLRSMKQQMDESIRALALQDARQKDEQRAQLNQRLVNQRKHVNTIPTPVPIPVPTAQSRMMTPSNSHHSSSAVPISSNATTQLLQSLPRGAGRVVQNQTSSNVEPSVIKKVTTTPVSLRDAFSSIRQSVAEKQALELEPAPIPVVEPVVETVAPPPTRQEFLERMKRMQAERKAQAPPAVVPDTVHHQPEQNHVAVVVDPKKQAFLTKFKERQEARYSAILV